MLTGGTAEYPRRKRPRRAEPSRNETRRASRTLSLGAVEGAPRSHFDASSGPSFSDRSAEDPFRRDFEPKVYFSETSLSETTKNYTRFTVPHVLSTRELLRLRKSTTFDPPSEGPWAPFWRAFRCWIVEQGRKFVYGFRSRARFGPKRPKCEKVDF